MKNEVKVRLYAIIERAVEEGSEFGYNRAFKHTDQPSKEHILESIRNEIMNALCEVISFDE